MSGQRPTVGLRSAREGYCTSCGANVGTIAHIRLASMVVRVCAPCAKALRRQLKDFAGSMA